MIFFEKPVEPVSSLSEDYDFKFCLTKSCLNKITVVEGRLI